jgi:hypothetical protein
MEHLLIGLLIIVILVMALFMIKSKKCLGGHRYAISSKGLNQEIWYKKDSYTNKRKPDSDSARNRHYIIRTCTKCGDEIAESYLEDDPKGTREVLAVSYAKSLISAIHKKPWAILLETRAMRNLMLPSQTLHYCHSYLIKKMRSEIVLFSRIEV